MSDQLRYPILRLLSIFPLDSLEDPPYTSPIINLTFPTTLLGASILWIRKSRPGR
jgi:hypothetical protein